MTRLREILSEADKGLASFLVKKDKLTEEIDRLDKRIDSLKKIVTAIKGLEETKKGMMENVSTGRYSYDPGKYGPAYFYVKSIEDAEDSEKRDIIHSFKPCLSAKCSSCNSKVPVLMSYEQTYDSPDGDMWEKIAFTVCSCGTYNELSRVCQTHRFL